MKQAMIKSEIAELQAQLDNDESLDRFQRVRARNQIEAAKIRLEAARPTLERLTNADGADNELGRILSTPINR